MSAAQAIPPRWRKIGYRVMWLATPLVTYAYAVGWIGTELLALWAAYGTMFGVTADANTLTPRKPRHTAG